VNVLKVAAQSKPTAVAGAVAGLIRENGRAELQAIGAGAVNQAIKAVAISRSYLSPQHMDVICVPTFMEVEINHCQRTGLRLVVQRWDYDEVHNIASESTDVHRDGTETSEVEPQSEVRSQKSDLSSE
jgi:stage V sporulation protein S